MSNDRVCEESLEDVGDGDEDESYQQKVDQTSRLHNYESQSILADESSELVMHRKFVAKKVFEIEKMNLTS
jgi:hypothetical protein